MNKSLSIIIVFSIIFSACISYASFGAPQYNNPGSTSGAGDTSITLIDTSTTDQTKPATSTSGVLATGSLLAGTSGAFVIDATGAVGAGATSVPAGVALYSEDSLVWNASSAGSLGTSPLFLTTDSNGTIIFAR